jgi:predicted DNA-binding protein (MmcQ/YjbR family)
VISARAKLLDHALALPEAWLDHPWGEDVAKVGKKIFVFFGLKGTDLGIGVKLPRSLLFARTRFARGDDVPLDLMREWIEESYEAIAPKKLAAAPRKAKRA